MTAEADIEGGEVAAPQKKKLPIMLIAMAAAVSASSLTVPAGPR